MVGPSSAARCGAEPGDETMPTKTRKPAARKAAPAKPEPHTSKQQQVIEMLRRPEGATVNEIAEATGWQPHTVRGFISALRKGKSGKRAIEQVAIETVRDGGRTTYRAAPADA